MAPLIPGGVTKTVTRTVTNTIEKIPGWADGNEGLKKLAGIGTGGAATLLAFAENPQEFIIGTVLEALVGYVLSAGAVAVEAVASVWEPLLGLPQATFAPVFDAGGSILLSFQDFATSINTSLEGLAASAGPAAPIVIVLFWAVALVLLMFAFRVLFYKVLPLVIPWL